MLISTVELGLESGCVTLTLLPKPSKISTRRRRVSGSLSRTRVFSRAGLRKAGDMEHAPVIGATESTLFTTAPNSYGPGSIVPSAMRRI